MREQQIKNTKEIVTDILREQPKARDNDALLICLVYNKLGHHWTQQFGTIMSCVSDGELPSLETITRVRRKVQEEYPDLRGEVSGLRKELQEEYKQLAKGEI